MKNWHVKLLAVGAVFCALVFSPGVTRADDLTGSAQISYVYGSTTFATGTIAVGSSISCPSVSPSAICSLFLGSHGEPLGVESFSVGPTSITYSISDYPDADYGGTFNGFDFTDLTVSGGGSLTGFTIPSLANSVGLTSSDVTIGSNSVDVNLVGLPMDGTFTIDLLTTPVAAPEPSSLVLLGVGLFALIAFARKRLAPDRFEAELVH